MVRSRDGRSSYPDPGTDRPRPSVAGVGGESLQSGEVGGRAQQLDESGVLALARRGDSGVPGGQEQSLAGHDGVRGQRRDGPGHGQESTGPAALLGS